MIRDTNKPLAPVFKEFAAEMVIQQSRQLLASETFRKKATPEEIRDIERALLQAEATLAQYSRARSGGGGGQSIGAVGMSTTMDPATAVAALALVAIGAVFLSQGPGAKQAAQSLDDALDRVRDRISQIAGRSGAAAAAATAAVATATVVQATSLDTLGKILGLPPGQLQPLSKATLDAIRRGIQALIAGTVPPRCKDLHDDYLNKLKKANSAIAGGAGFYKTGFVWVSFVEAALDLARCLTGGGGPPGGAAPA